VQLTVGSTEVVRLTDDAHRTELSIAPPMGNMAYDMKVNGQPILWSPYETVAQWSAKPVQLGIPFLGPWANRLDQDAFYANGKKYVLNPGVIDLSRDSSGQPIHGLLLFASDWKIVRLRADDDAAEVTSRLEFWRHPEWMAQFPFAQAIEMTHRLCGGTLEVRTSVENLSTEPMPLSIGFHPWYRITDCPRDEWRLHLPVREHYLLGTRTTPTGATEQANLPAVLPLVGRQLDDVYGGLDHNDEFFVEGRRQKISVRFGPKYPIAVVYAPLTRPVVCFEPMTGITNAFNLAHAGFYKGLQSVPPGQTWTESFWVHPSGY
jgi:aldose 1-epimerase